MIAIATEDRHHARAVALDALEGADPDRLQVAAELTRGLTGGSTPGHPIWAYAELVEAMSYAVRWRSAVRQADPAGPSYLAAAKARVDDVLAQARELPWPSGLQDAAQRLRDTTRARDVDAAAQALVTTPLPMTASDVFGGKRHLPFPISQPQEKPLRCLVLVEVAGKPLTSPLRIKPHTTQRVAIRVVPEKWPEGAEAVKVSFASVLRTVHLGEVVVRRGDESGETFLEVETGIDDPSGPVELLARATVEMKTGNAPAMTVVGHPRIHLATFDATTALPIDMPFVADRLWTMDKELLSKLPSVPQVDREDWFKLMVGLINFRQFVLAHGFPGMPRQLSESDFQYEVVRFLMAHPEIGARLMTGGNAAQGTKDIGLGRVPLELKVEKKHPVSLTDARRYIGQASQYSSSHDRPLSILCILDLSTVTDPLGISAEYIDWLYPKSHGLTDPRFPAMVAVVIVQGNLPVPSAYSRKGLSTTRRSKTS